MSNTQLKEGDSVKDKLYNITGRVISIGPVENVDILVDGDTMDEQGTISCNINDLERI